MRGAGAVQQLPVDAVQPRDLAVLGGDQLGPVMRAFAMSQPNPAASSAHAPYSPACTNSFFGTQPTLTQVPPQKRSSAIADPRAMPGGDAGAAHARRAAADHEQVEIVTPFVLRSRYPRL